MKPLLLPPYEPRCSPLRVNRNHVCWFVARVLSRELYEAEELLEEVQSWSEEEIEQLPRFYREKAREYRQLANSGEE